MAYRRLFGLFALVIAAALGVSSLLLMLDMIGLSPF